MLSCVITGCYNLVHAVTESQMGKNERFCGLWTIMLRWDNESIHVTLSFSVGLTLKLKDQKNQATPWMREVSVRETI